MTEEEKQELEALRKEKRERALREAGVPATFAPLPAGEDDGGTDRRTEAFCAAYQEVRRRLPREAPPMDAPPPSGPSGASGNFD